MTLYLLSAAVALLVAAVSLPATTIRHFYYLDDRPAQTSLAKWRSAVDVLSPVWLEVDENSTLQVKIDSAVLDFARRHHIRLAPVLVNKEFRPAIAERVLGREDAQQTVVAAVLAAVIEHGFYGIQLDFENVAARDRDRLTRFAANLGNAMRSIGRQFSVAVVSPLIRTGQTDHGGKPTWKPTDQSAAFDYRMLARNADLISLMAYDEHTSPDEPGPIASLPWVDACIAKVLEQVPSEKLLLGIPFYYRRWSGKAVTVGSYAEAQALAAKAAARVQLDRAFLEPTFSFRDGALENTIWLQNAASLRLRLDLVRRYRLGGFSAWRLGQEDPAAWRALGVSPKAPAPMRPSAAIPARGK